jgi:hypothetical protein
MAKPEEIQTINLALKSIEEIEYFIKKPATPVKPDNEFYFEIFMNQRISPNKSILVNNCVILIFDNKEKSELVCRLSTDFFFHVQNLENYAIVDEHKRLSISSTLLLNVNSVTMSTSRGILFGRNSGTYLKNFNLPLMDVSKMQIKEPTEVLTNKKTS